MIPQTYVNQAQAALGPTVATQVTDDRWAYAFMQVLSRLWSEAPACRLLPTGLLVDASSLSPVTPANWDVAIWLDDVYGPAVVAGLCASVLGADADDTFDLSRSQMYEKNFKALLAIPG